jgi:hypothetical protein
VRLRRSRWFVKETTSAPASSPQTTPSVCQNPTECSTQTTGQLLTGVTVSDPSNPHDVMDALHQNYNTQLQTADQATGYALVQSLCAPVGSTGQFPTNDYMCGSVIQSTSDGQDTYGATALFNVRSDGTVYVVGTPCAESTPASGCDANYWNLVQQQWQSASATPAPAPTTQTTSATSCGPFNVPGGNPSHYTNITVTGTSCSTGRAVATSDAVAPGGRVPVAAEGYTCASPSNVRQCVNGSAEVDLYSNPGP